MIYNARGNTIFTMDQVKDNNLVCSQLDFSDLVCPDHMICCGILLIVVAVIRVNFAGGNTMQDEWIKLKMTISLKPARLFYLIRTLDHMICCIILLISVVVTRANFAEVTKFYSFL